MGNAPHTAGADPGTSRRRDAQRACRDLTLDLFLRRGAFWEHVRDRRHRLQAQDWSRRLREWEDAGGRCATLDESGDGRRCPGCLYCAPPDDTDDALRAVPPSLF
ncbi:MAG: hypothetical protein M3Q10_01005, partial [Chloroflexota bacterium]|nr:hypothetical protein [Chloroflexota bacterium]